MAYRSEVYLLCTPKMGNELKKATATAEKVYQPEIINYENTVYFKWRSVPWEPLYFPFCKDIYDVLQKFANDPDEGYKLIRFGEGTTDIEEDYNDTGFELFDSKFVPLRTIQLPLDL